LGKGKNKRGLYNADLHVSTRYSRRIPDFM